MFSVDLQHSSGGDREGDGIFDLDGGTFQVKIKVIVHGDTVSVQVVNGYKLNRASSTLTLALSQRERGL